MEEKAIRDRDATLGKVYDSLPLASRYLSEAAALLAAGASPAVGLKMNIPPMGADDVTPVNARGAAGSQPTFSNAGVHAAMMLSQGAVQVAYPSPVVAAAVPLIAQEAGALKDKPS